MSMLAMNMIEHVDTNLDPDIDPRVFRDVMGHFTTGVAVVTSVDAGGNPVGVTVNSLTSVSLQPALLLWSLALNAASLPVFRSSGMFAVNILASDQLELCETFAKRSLKKFHGVDYSCDESGMPLLSGALAHIVCSTWQRYPGGDHEIFVGRVRTARAMSGQPLALFCGSVTRQDAVAARPICSK